LVSLSGSIANVFNTGFTEIAGELISMTDPKCVPITQLLSEIRDGKALSADILISSIYGELHKIAARMMRSESPGHTLQPTAVVNEAFLRLFGGVMPTLNDRQHFFAIAARQIRCVLVDHARAKSAQKRGSRTPKVELSELTGAATMPESADILALDELLARLAKHDSRAAQVVELKYFAGMTDQEISKHLGINHASVRRDWEFARAWLARHWESSSAQPK
jgi:RNA polymerase sigma-70 factor, ECF subfamily